MVKYLKSLPFRILLLIGVILCAPFVVLGGSLTFTKER